MFSSTSADIVIANFLRVALEDLDGAKQLASTKNRNAVYLCEQAAAGKIKAMPSPNDMAKYLADVEAVLSGVAARFGVDLAKPNTPATMPQPIR